MDEYDADLPDLAERRQAVGCGLGFLCFLVGGIIGGLAAAYKASQTPGIERKVPPALLKFVRRYIPRQHSALVAWIGEGALLGGILLGLLGYFLGRHLIREEREAP
jgi:hypothetical protein